VCLVAAGRYPRQGWYQLRRSFVPAAWRRCAFFPPAFKTPCMLRRSWGGRSMKSWALIPFRCLFICRFSYDVNHAVSSDILRVRCFWNVSPVRGNYQRLGAFGRWRSSDVMFVSVVGTWRSVFFAQEAFRR